MKTLIVLFLSFFFVSSLSAQLEMEVQLNNPNQNAEDFCVELELINPNMLPMKIEGQNVLLFYDSEKLRFDGVFLNGMLPLEAYDVNLMTDIVGLDGSYASQLHFDENMGFVNYAITAKDFKDNKGIVDAGQYALAQTICFKTYQGEPSIGDIVLARGGKTDAYSKAFGVTVASPIQEEIMLPTKSSDLLAAGTLAGLHD